MGTRDEWNNYRLDDGLNIWGAPEFQGMPVFAGGLTHGDEVFDTLVMNGRIATGSLAGEYLDIDATFGYNELAEIRAQITDWTLDGGAGNPEFKTLYMRTSANLSDALAYLQGVSFISRAESAIDLYAIRSAVFEVNLRAGGQTITYVRGMEICINSPAVSGTVPDPTVNCTDFKILQLETQLNSDIAPTTNNVGLWFEIDSAAGASIANFHEIRMARSDIRILTYSADPNGAVTAPVGSLCLVPTGSGAADRLWMNTDSGTTWTAISTAA